MQRRQRARNAPEREKGHASGLASPAKGVKLRRRCFRRTTFRADRRASRRPATSGKTPSCSEVTIPQIFVDAPYSVIASEAKQSRVGVNRDRKSTCLNSSH